MQTRTYRSLNLIHERVASKFITFKKIISLLSNKDKKKGIHLFLLMLLAALLDAFGVASLLPFIAVVSNGDLIEKSRVLGFLYRYLNFTSLKDFQFFLGSIVFIFIIFSLVLKALTTYAQIRFSLICECSISKRLVENYLYQPYVWFLNRHSADLGRSILSEVNNVIFNGLFPCLTILSQGLIAITLIILLLMVDPFLAISVSVLLSATYILIYRFSSKLVNSLSRVGIEANKERHTAVNEAFSGIKEVKASGVEHLYLARFLNPAFKYTKSQAAIQLISQMPRYALEAVAVGGMVLIVLFLLGKYGDVVNVLPVIALYTFAGYRLMPALQQIYHSLNQIRYIKLSVDNLYDDMVNIDFSENKINIKNVLSFKSGISINEISFKYPNSSINAINRVSIFIPTHSSVGIVGLTGSGKTTLVDIILGLLEPEAGFIKADDQIINKENVHQWKKFLGYVPQQIHLFDESIKSNIAFGTDRNEINQSKVEAAAIKANIHDFIVNQLPMGYDTIVGERGIRLSGGQRQRLGIARALYNNPQILVLDEGTSSLDTLTESMVMEQINRLGRQITTIFIAHRLGTVRHCDKIYLLHEGSVISSGTYDELIKSDAKFRSMVNEEYKG